MPCLNEETYLSLMEGLLPPAEARAAEAHLDTCVGCRRLVAAGLADTQTPLPETPHLSRLTLQDSALAKIPIERSDSVPLAEGAELGRYVVERLVGEGGMGRVYSAFDPGLSRRVALKVLRPEVDAQAPDARPRMLREAQAMAQLNHPNVVPIFDVGEHGGQFFIAMGFVNSRTLADWMVEGPGWEEIREVFMLAGRGLAAAHAAGLVHRDFKPHNVLIGEDQDVRVTDFGLVRSVQAPADAEQAFTALERSQCFHGLAAPITRVGAFMGTPAYMSPEQLLGRPADARSDQYSFCVSLFEAVRGVRPFGGKTIEALLYAMRVGTQAPAVKETGAPQGLDAILARGLSFQTEARFDTLDDLLLSLAEVAHPRLPRPIPRSRTKFFSAAVGVFVLAVAGSWWGFRRSSDVSTSDAPAALSHVRPEPIPSVTPASLAPRVTEPEPDAVPEILTQTPEQPPAPAAVKVTLKTHPSTDVYWGRRHLGQTPLTAALQPGRTELRFVNERLHLHQSVRLVVPARGTLRRTVAFKKGTLAINCSPWADIYLNDDNHKLDTTPMGPRVLFEGSYAVRLVNSELGSSKTVKVVVRAGRTTVLNERLAPATKGR